MQLCQYMAEKVNNLKDIHQLVIILNIIYDNTDGRTYRVCSDLIKKLLIYSLLKLMKYHPRHTILQRNVYLKKLS